jgi:glycosyltransferase involved in cell wall biosynthesis
MNLENYRILYISSQFPTRANPQTGVFSIERVRALIRGGCQVSVIAPVLMTPHPNLIAKPGQLVRWYIEQARLPAQSRVAEIVVHHPKWFCPPKALFGWYFSAFMYAQIKPAVLRAAAELHPQVILSSWLPDGVAACHLGERLGLPTLCIADGSDVNEWPKKYSRWQYARGILNNKASAIIYVSEALRQTGKANGLSPRSDAVIHNSVNTHVFQPNPDKREDNGFSILAVGRMTPVKGYPVLLEAFAEFTRCLEKPTCLTIVGDGLLRPALEAQAAELGIASQVRFIGAVAPEQVPAYYQASDLFCLPSFSEGLPCVAVEAMACGKPVVASNVGGVSEVVDDQSGIMVAPGDPKALSQALLAATSRNWDPDIIRHKIVEEFSWSRWTEKIFKLIKNVLADQPEELDTKE